jgi:hypothetical protein
MIRALPKIITRYVFTTIIALCEKFIKTGFTIIIAVWTACYIFPGKIFATIVAVAEKIVPTILAVSFAIVPHCIVFVHD